MQQLSNDMAFGHNELWFPKVAISLSVTFQMLWPLVTTNCGSHRMQIASLTSQRLWPLATSNSGGRRLQIASLTSQILWPLVTMNCGCRGPLSSTQITIIILNTGLN